MKKTLLCILTMLLALPESEAQLQDSGWIGTSRSFLYSDYLPIFRYHCTLQLDAASRSTDASVLLGGNDPRLMNRNLNIQGVECGRDESYIRIEYDIKPVASGNNACIHVYRAGYTASDRPDEPIDTFEIPEEVIPAGQVYAPVYLQIEGTASILAFHVNGHKIGQSVVNPHGDSHDYIGYPQLAEIGYAMRAGQKAILSDVRITHHRSPHNTLYSSEKPVRIGGRKPQLHLYDPSNGGLPELRSSFMLKDKEISSATLYATARGIYEAYINGKKVGDEWYAPGVSQYNKTHYYQKYEVDSLLQKGMNQIRVQLAEGWWMGYVTYSMTNWNFFGDQLAFRSRMVVHYSDGDSTVVSTRPEGWEVSVDGPVQYASMFMGQVTDNRRRNREWRPAEEICLEGHLPWEGEGTTPKVNDYSGQRMPEAQSAVRAYKTLTAQSMTEVRPGVYIYDMGQNMAGVPRIHLPALPEGSEIRLRFAEVLYPDIPAYSPNEGTLMLENIRAALAQDIFISDGKPAVFEPHFTQHGYRYLEITGLPAPLPEECVQSVVVSSIDRFDSHFECSNPLVNRLWDNIRWSTLGNFISLPTDCPQRNERMGWSGDINVYARTASYLWNCKEFLRKHLQSMRDIQLENGRFPDVAPIGGGFGGFMWGTAGITVPWELWLQYGDSQILSEHYDAMKRYMDYVESEYIDRSSGLFVQNSQEAKLADWLGLEDRRNDKSLLFECYYIYDLDIMCRVAQLFGKTADAERFEQTLKQRKEFFAKTYLEPETCRTIASAFMEGQKGMLIDIQGSYVLPLAFDAVEGETKKRVFDNLVRTIERTNTTDTGVPCPPYSLMTGFITTSWISRVLTDNGRADIAYRMLQNEQYPSWLYPVTQGATTIWERLNSYTHEDGFGGNNAMNSFNHYSFGAVGQWLMNRCLGIERDEMQPGFKHFHLRPVADPTGQMTYARGHYDTQYGRIESSWTRKPDGKVEYVFSIPQGTTATVTLPGKEPQLLNSGEYTFISQ